MASETWFSRRRLLQSGVALGTLALAGCSGGGSTPTTTNKRFRTQPEPANTPTPTETPPEYTTVDDATPTASMGEVVADEKLALVVLQKQVKTKSDKTRIWLDTQIRNRTSGEYLTFKNMRSYLTNSEGKQYLRRLTASDRGAEVYDEELAPGELAWSNLLYAGSGSASMDHAVFTFDSPAISFDEVRIDLSKTSKPVATLENHLDVVTHNVGETVTESGLAVTVEGVDVRQQIKGANSPGKHKVFVIPSLKIENTGEEARTIRTHYQTSLKDGHGRAFGIDDSARQALSDGFDRKKQIAPGHTRTGTLPFVTPSSVGSLDFVFDFSINFGGFRRFWSL
ncbi:MAG: DUF4352 domain-containing protein [Halorientalis sp.]